MLSDNVCKVEIDQICLCGGSGELADGEMCIVNADPTDSAQIFACVGDNLVPAISCYCGTRGIGTEGDFCDSSNDILTHKCVLGNVECPGEGPNCVISNVSCVCAGIVAVQNEICVDAASENQILRCEPSARVLSATCTCSGPIYGSATADLSQDDFCSIAGGDTLVSCGDITIESTNCICGDLEGYVGQTCSAGVLICLNDALVLSRSCACASDVTALKGQFCLDGLVLPDCSPQSVNYITQTCRCGLELNAACYGDACIDGQIVPDPCTGSGETISCYCGV